MTNSSIHTPRLVLRTPNPRDTHDLVTTFSDPQVARMLGSIPHNYGIANAQKYIQRVQALDESSTECLLAITRNETLIGTIRIAPRDGNRFISYALSRVHWGQGLMSEAVCAMIEHYFATRKVREIYADFFFDNLASEHVLQKVGFERVSERMGHSQYRCKDVLEICAKLTRKRFMEMRSTSSECSARKSINQFGLANTRTS